MFVKLPCFFLLFFVFFFSLWVDLVAVVVNKQASLSALNSPTRSIIHPLGTAFFVQTAVLKIIKLSLTHLPAPFLMITYVCID